MDQDTTAKRTFSDILTRPTATEKREAREILPFLLIVTAALAVLYAVSLQSQPGLRQAPAIILFSALMLLYLLGFWLVFLFQVHAASLRMATTYLIIQTALALGLAVMAQSLAVSFGLFAPLIGITVGMFRNRKLAAVAVVILLVLSGLSAIWTEGLDALLGWLLFAIPLTIFVVVYVVLYTRQAEAREEAQRLLEELEVAHAQLAAYAIQVEDLTLAAERQRMARELHDTLAQGLAGLILQLEAGKSHLEQGNDRRTLEILDQALVRARATLADARRAIGDLRTANARPDDLASTVRAEAERFSRATGIPCAVDLSLPAVLPGDVAEHVGRIVAEALSNVARHAQASQVWIAAVAGPHRFDLEVRDDGAGFDPQAAPDGGHYGLLGMRERARLAGGTLAVASSSGQGTTVRVQVPLPAELVEVERRGER